MVELYHKVLGTTGRNIEKDIKKEEERNNIMSDVDLRSLIELGCVKDIVEIDSFKFVMRSLSATERIELSQSFTRENLTNEEQFKFNVRLLAIAIESVNGKPLELLHPRFNGEETKETVLKMKIDIISSLQTPVIAKLLEFYVKIMERCDNQFDIEQVKN